MPFTALAVGAGLGLLKSQAIDRPKEERQRKLAAETQRYSPWTGLKADPIQEADPMGSALQYGATGAGVVSGIQGAKAQTDWLNRGGNPEFTSALNGSGGAPMAAAGMGGNKYSLGAKMPGFDAGQYGPAAPGANMWAGMGRPRSSNLG